MEPEFVSWRRHRVHVKVTGQGDPLLLITGLGGNTDMWTPFAQQFPNRRVIRFDVPGMGLSSMPLAVLPVAQNVTIEVILNAVLGVADEDMRRRFRRHIDDTLFYPLGALRLRTPPVGASTSLAAFGAALAKTSGSLGIST